MEELVEAANMFMDAWNNGPIIKRQEACERLYQLTGRQLYRSKNWYTIKNAVDGILLADARNGAGNSGTH